VKRAPRLMLLLTNPGVMGDATIAALFCRQMAQAVPGARMAALVQPPGVALLRRAGVAAEALGPTMPENHYRIRQMHDELRPDLVLLAELRNFLDQLLPDDVPPPSVPFVANVSWESLRHLSAPLVSFDNLPADRYGTQVRRTGMPLIVPVPPLEPAGVQRLGPQLRVWCSLPERPRVEPRRPGRRLRVLLTLSEWSAQLALERGLGLYYLVLERQLTRVLEALSRPVTLLVAGGPARYLGRRPTGRVRVEPLGALSPARYERLLLGADLLVTDHALQLSLVRRLRAALPALLLRQSLSYEDRERPPFELDAQSASLLELWLQTRVDCFWPWDIFPLPSEAGLLDSEPFFWATPKADLFDAPGMLALLRELQDAEAWQARQGPLEALFERAQAAPLAPQVVSELLAGL
jgi:hypothetical protein